MRVLAVDDDEALLAEVKRILINEGHSVECANNADTALDIVKAGHYDFVLVDYRMPRHDGMWFLENARLPRSTRVLLVSSFADGTLIRQMFEVGISGYLTKPFDEGELLMHLRFHTGDHRIREHKGQTEAPK